MMAVKNRIPKAGWRLIAVACLLLALFFSAGWREAGGDNLDQRKVAKIKNGVTKKHEIILWFGEPKEIIRSPEGLVYKYVGYTDAPPKDPKTGRPLGGEDSRAAFYLDEDHKMKKLPTKTEGKMVKSRLTIYFAPDGNTVQSHEFERVDGKK
ncbi:MAG: hypothetical protein WHT07_00465 [Desulfobaccales bacterium]